MTLHPLVAAIKISFDTLFVPEDKLRDVMTLELADWAGINLESEADMYAYDEVDEIKRHEPIIHDFIKCIHEMLLKKQLSAKEILLSIFTQNTEAASFKELENCHNTFLNEVEIKIQDLGPITENSDPLDEHDYYSALEKKKYNVALFQEIYLPDEEQFFSLYDTATTLDQTLQIKNLHLSLA